MSFLSLVEKAYVTVLTLIKRELALKSQGLDSSLPREAVFCHLSQYLKAWWLKTVTIVVYLVIGQVGWVCLGGPSAAWGADWDGNHLRLDWAGATRRAQRCSWQWLRTSAGCPAGSACFIYVTWFSEVPWSRKQRPPVILRLEFGTPECHSCHILLVKITKSAKIQELGRHTSPFHVRSDSYDQGEDGLVGLSLETS